MASRFERYRVARGDNIGDPDYWNGRFRDVDTRLVAVEEQKDTIDEVIEEGRIVFRTRVDEILVPLVQGVNEIAELGALLRAHSSSTVEVSTGGKTFFVDEADRLRFAAPSYLSILATGNPSLAMSGALVSYASATGELVVDIDQVEGAGWGADWTISVGNTTDTVADAAAALAARDAARSARDTAVAAMNDIADVADAVADLRDQAVAANGQAQQAKVLAEAAEAGTVSAIASWASAVLPPSEVAPTERQGGAALQIGDQYFRPSEGKWRTWDGVQWTINAVSFGSEVNSVFGRGGAISAQTGDYRGDQISRTAGQQAILPGGSVEDAIQGLKSSLEAEITVAVATIDGGTFG